MLILQNLQIGRAVNIQSIHSSTEEMCHSIKFTGSHEHKQFLYCHFVWMNRNRGTEALLLNECYHRWLYLLQKWAIICVVAFLWPGLNWNQHSFVGGGLFKRLHLVNTAEKCRCPYQERPAKHRRQSEGTHEWWRRGSMTACILPVSLHGASEWERTNAQ